MLRIVFMGTPQFSVPTLSELIGAGHDVVAVYSQPPRPAGRGMSETKSPVQQFAEAAQIPVFTPKSLKTPEAQAQFRAHDADVAVVVAYGLLLPQAILDAPREGCFNLHASLLPRWRGAAPIQRAIMAGDAASGAMVMKMDIGLDTGPVCLAERMELGADITAGVLHDALSLTGAQLVVRAMAALERGSLIFTPQASQGVTYAAKIDKAEAKIDFTRSAHEVHNRVRGLSPFPGAWFEMTMGEKAERVKVLASSLSGAPVVGGAAAGTVINGDLWVACGDGKAVRLVTVQRAGKSAMDAGSFVRGASGARGASGLVGLKLG
ncbi:MAG: methionyl-tRNA formyltransferase [Hyphomicrobiaceae bacterium]|nr:methionyl-tRNA formyltransferase [Hyphomicrobiaceae bacterium]